MLKRNRRWFSMSTLVFFLFFELFYFPAQNGFAQNLVSEVKSAQGFFLALPKDLGRVEITHTGQGPSLIHIQTAHGNYEAEQNIRKILHYLKNEHDFKTVFLEGSAFKLEPERLKLFKKHKKITYQILDQLMRRAFVKGSELFLLEDSEAQGFGVEHLETYVHNTRAFYEVLKQQKSTASFLTVLDEQIARLQSVFFSSDLRSFLKQKARYDEKEYDFLAWCELLRKKASKTLKIDLKDVAYQMDWPMLLRLFKLQELQSQINTQSFESEREKFLTNIKTIPKDLWIRVEKLLNANLSQDHLPNPETIKTFEAMIENLKADFDYEAYPQVKLFITHLILQSELDASRLQEEIDRLFIKISHSMMETDVQRKVFELYRHHELLTHLFELQLTPREYEQLSEHREKLSPKTLFENLSALNQDKRIELLNFEGVEEIEKLFGKSFEFYVLAKERDEKMIQNVEEQMQKQKVEKAVVITGGFHAEPFSEYFKEKLYNYALISPKMTDFEGQQSYVESMLQTLQPQSRESASATLESIPFASHSPQQILAMGFDPRQIALIFLDEAYRFLTSENTKFSPAQFNQMAMQGGAFKGFSLSFVKNEQGEDVFKITFPDGTIIYVGQQDVKQVIVRQTVGFDLGNPLNTIPGVSNQTAGTYLKLPQASSPAQSDSALFPAPRSLSELRSSESESVADSMVIDQFRKDEIVAVLKSYSFEADVSFRLAAKNKDNVFIVQAGNEKFILKQPKFRNKEDLILWEASLLESLEEQGLLVSKMLKNNDGQYYTENKGHFYILYEFVEGEDLGWGGVEGQDVAVAAKTLAQMHNAAKEVQLLGRSYSAKEMPRILPIVGREVRMRKLRELLEIINSTGPPDTEMVQVIRSHSEAKNIERHLERFDKALNPAVVAQLPKSIVHGDFHQANAFFVDERKKMRLMDFEYSRDGEARIYDLVNAITLRFQTDGTSLDLNKIRDFIIAYETEIDEPLTDLELQVLPDVIRAGYLEVLFLGIESRKEITSTDFSWINEQLNNLAVLDHKDWASFRLAIRSSRSELRSTEMDERNVASLMRTKETVVVDGDDPRDEPLSDLSLWTQLFGHRYFDASSTISLKDVLTDSIQSQRQSGDVFRFMDIGTGNGKFVRSLKQRLQRIGIQQVEGVGIESDPGRWGLKDSKPEDGYYVANFLHLEQTFPELMQKYDLLTLNAPQLSVRHLETDSQFQVKLLDFSSWLNQIKKIMKENGRLIIRLYEPESMVDGNEADWLHIESALLQKALAQHPDLQYAELGMNIQGLPKGSANLGPAILVQFKNPPRAELRQSDDDDDDYSWVIPGGTLPADYQLDGRIGWDGLIGHRRDREAMEIKFQDLVRSVLAEKRKGELLQFLDIGTGDGNFVSALKRVLNDQGISDVKGIGVDLKNATFLEADLTPGETYFQVDLQNPEEVITGVELNSQDFVFMNAPQLIKTVTSAGRKRFLSVDDFSPWLKRAKSLLAEKGYLIIRLFEEKNDISDFSADWMKIESHLLRKALEDDTDLYFWEVRGDLADLPTGSTSVGPAIIVQKRSRSELRSGVDPLRRKDGGVFPEAVRAVEAIAAAQNDVRRPVEEQPRRSNVEISAQAEAYQLFMQFTAEQQPELKDKLNEIVIHPADYDQFTRVHQPDVTEAAVISARFSPWDIRSILNQFKSDALLVIGYESYEADRANSDMQLLGEIKQEGLLEEFSMGQMPAGQYIIIARKARSELRADDVFLTDANEGSLFPEAVSAIEQIVASRNDPQPSDQKVDFRRMRISQAGAQKAAHQLFTTYAEKQQPQLRESLPSLMIFPTDYEKYQAQRTNKTEVVILSSAFSEHSIGLILKSLRDDTLLVIGYEDDEKNVLEQHQKFLTRLQSEGLVKEFSSGEMSTGQYILIARKARSELRSSFDKAFKGFAEMPEARTRLLAMIYENLHQNRSNKVAWYTNAGADIIHPLAVGNPDILIMNDRLDLFASEDFSDAAFQTEIDQMALNAATGEEALATFQEKGGALLPLLLRGFQQLGVSKEDLKAEVVRQKGQDVEQAIKFTFHWKHPAEKEARLRVVYFLGRKPLQSLSDLPNEIEDFIVENSGLDLMIEKAPNYYKDLLRMDLEGLERGSAEKTSAYRESQALIEQINAFRMKWLKKGGVILGDRESTDWPSSIGVLTRQYAAQYLNIKYWKTRMYEFFSIGTLSKWGNGSSLIYQRTQGEPQGLKDREEKKKSSMLTPEIFQKAFQHRVGISEDDNQDFIEAFTNQFNQGVFDLVLDPRREAADDYDARATQALMNSDYSTAIIVRFEQILSVIRKGLDEGQAIEDIEEEVGKTQKFIVNYLRDVDQFGIILDTASLTSYNGISGIRAFIDYHAQALYILASRYAEARPDLKENPIANIFLRPILTDEEFDEAFKLLGRGVAIGDSEEFRGDFIEQYNEGFFDDVLNPQRNPDVYDYPQKINQAFSRSDISKALVLMFLQSLQVLRKGLDDGKSPEAILEEVKKITDKMSPHLNLEHDEDIFSGVIDDEVLEPYGGALGLMSYVNYIDHAVHILSDKYRKARSELRTDDEATSFEDSLNPELRRISLLEENEKNSQMLIPIALGYVELFEELASHGARADLEGTAVVDVELFFQDQQLKLRTSSGRSSPILGYDLLMKTLSDESKTDENGNIIRTQSIFFEPLDLQSSLARTMAQDNPNFIPYIYDDEYPVLFESQLSRDKKNMRNVNAIYVGGLYSNKFLKLEILKRKEGGDQWMPLLVSDVIFQSEAVSAVLGIDGKPFKMDRPDQIQRFISQGDLANILVRASFVDDPRKLRSELRSPEDYRERAKAKASILESEGYQYVLQIVPEDLRKNNGKSAQLSSVREMLSNISTENRWNENMTQRLTHLTHEILYNLIEHGEGAAFAITFDREGGKIKNIGIAALDSGVGIDDPNVLLNNSTRRKVRSFLEGVEPQVYGGNGFVTYMSRANDVVIESKGKRWQKSGMNHFKESHSDDVPEEGSKLSFTVDLSENVGPIHESYFLHRWTLFRLMKLLSENRWMPFGGHDIDGLTEVLMLSDDDLILKKQELFGEKNDTDRVGIIPTAIATGQYKTLDFKVYQKIIELSLELSNLQRSDFPEHATEQVKVRSEAFIQQWNERYQRQDGKPSREEGHLGVQFARADMEKGPGSIYEFNALRQFANDFLDDRDLPLQNKAETLVADITIILTELKKASLLTEEMESRLLRNIPILQESAKLYQQRMIGYLPNKEEVLQEYYEAASFTFRVIPTLIESIFRIKKSSEISSMYAIEDGFEVQNETSMHFDIRTGFEYRQREQIGIPNEVNALEHFRENPARVIAAYQYALEKNLPLSHQLRLALIQYQAEFQNWLDSQRLKRKPKESFTEVGRRFLKIMESDQSVMAVLWDMYRSGVLEAVVPELRKVQNLASNFEVHAFTVGQHTLYNLKNFESLRHASGPEPSEGEIIASRLNAAERRQMRLALLFHDLGKRISKTTIEADHAIVSARQIVPKRLKELGATQEDIQAVMWIVRDHMVLNAYAYYFKGDEFETKLPVIKNVIGIDPEASSERLKLLYLISLTDREALNPWLDMLNPDTLTRLNRIYSELEDFLASTGDHNRRHDIQALQQMAHEETRTGWETYKTNKSEGLRSRLENLNSETVKDYLSHMVLINDASIENKLMDRAKQIASDPQVFDELLERLFASFSLNKIRDFRIDQTLRRLLFLIHIQIQKESQSAAPLIYFNPYLSRTYERGYEILVGAGIDTTGFFEKATGVLLLHGFDIEEADIRTLSSGEILDKFHGFFHGDYPDEGAYQKLIEQITKDMNDVLMGVVPSIEALFKRANKPYLSQQSIESIETSVQFLEDESIYGVAASVFNLKTGNRLGLLHALSIILRRGGYNLVTAPVSTHPSMVNDIFYINKDGRTLTPKEKTDLVEEIRGVVSKRFIVFSDLRASRHELRNSDSETEASTMSIRVPLAEAIAAIQSRISETESNEVFEEFFTNPRLLSELVREYRGRAQRLDSFGLQAGWNKQAVVELVSNAMDWTLAGRGVTPIGRFAIGALQSFELLENEGDYVSWTSSTDGKNAYQLKVILTSEGSLDLELSSPVSYDFERGTRVEISKRGEVWKDYQDFLVKSFGLNTRVPILFIENGSESILNPLDLQQEREIFLINGSQSEKLAKHFYPDDRIQVQVQDDVLSVRDWGLGMSPKTFLTRLIRPRSGNNDNPNKKLTQEQIHQRVKVFYEKQGMIRADERVSSHISLQVAGVEIESVDVTGFNLPHMLAIELPAETNLSTERGNIALDEMTRDSMIAAIDKILNLEGAEKIPLLNAMAALLRKWQSKDGKQYEILLNTVQKKIRDWLEVERFAQPNQIVLPNRITLREEEKEEGQYFNEDAFQYLSLNADDEVIYLDDILFPFDPKKISKFKRVSNWYSDKGYQVWVVPFKESSNEIYFLHQNYIVVDEEHYRRHAANPAVLTQHINPILDYVPESLKTGRLRGHFILRQEKKTSKTDAPAPQQKTDTEWDILEGLKGYLIKQGLTAEQAQERIVSARVKTEEIIRENGLNQTPLFADSDSLASYDFHLAGYGALFNFLILYPDEMENLKKMGAKVRNLVAQDFFTLHDAGQIIYDYVMSYGAGAYYQKALKQVLEKEEREKEPWVSRKRQFVAQALARAGYFFHAEFLARDALRRIVEQQRNLNASAEVDAWDVLATNNDNDLEKIGLIRVLMGDNRDPLELWERKNTDNFWHIQKEVALQMLKEGDLDRALEFTRKIRHTSAAGEAYEAILNLLYQQKNLGLYREVLFEFENFTKNLNQLAEFMESSVNFDYAKASMLPTLSSFYRRINEDEKALQLEQEGYHLGLTLQTTFFFEEFYIDLLRGRTLNDDDFQSEGFLSLDGFRQANVLIAAKEWERAKQVIASLDSRYVYTKSMDVLAGQIETSPSLDDIQSLMDEIFDRRFNDELDEAALSVLKAAVIRFAELGKLEGSYAAVEANLQRLKSKGKLYGRDYERFVEPVLEKLMASEDLSSLRVFADKIKNEYPTGAALALIKSATIRVEQNLYADAQELWVEVEAIASQILPEKKDDLIHVYREMAVVERKLELAGVFSSEKNAILSEKIENEDLEKINQFLENAYFSKAKHRYQRRINLNMLRLPEPLNDADFSALAPFVTFLDHPLLAIVRPQTLSSLQSLLNSWTMSETEDFFDVINELNPRLIDVERFNTWLFKWATLFNGLRDHDGGLYLMIKKLTKAHSGVFWADEFDATHLPESMQDAALLMIVHYLRSGEAESLLEEVSSIDDLRSQVSETNRRLERFSVAEINAIYNAELSESAGDVNPKTNWKKIKSMSDYLDYRSRIKPIHNRDLDILSMQINKAIEGQDNSPDISQRELIQNSLKAHAQARIKEPIVVRSFIRKGAKHEWVKSVADKAGMELQDILGPLLVLDERAEITEADMSRGFFGIGFFTIFKDFDRVRLITSKGKGFPVYDLEIWRDPETKRIQVSIEENENDREYRGTIVEGIKEIDPNQNPIAQFIMANDNLLRYVAAVQDTPIIFNGKPINEVLQTMGKVNTAYGELRLSTSLSGRKRVALNGLFVESPEHENYFALVPKVYRDILLQSGITLELPEKVSLTSSRNTLAKKEEVLPEIQRAVALASYQMIVNLFLYDNVYPLGLTQDYLGESDVSVDADVAQDAALIKQGLFNQVNFLNYVAGEDALENEKMIKNRRMIELLTVIEVDDRANPGFKTSLDDERLKVLGKKEGTFSGTSLTAKYYAEHGKALSERKNDFKPYAPEVLNQPRLQAFITLGDVLLEMMGEGGVSLVLGESTTKDIPAFFMPLFNTISWDLAMTEIEHLTTHFYRIVAGESFDAEDLYSFFYHYTDILFHEAAHVYSGTHQREKMEGLFGWHKDQLLKKFLLNQTSLQQVVEEVRKRLTAEGTPLSSEASATPQNFLGYRAELRVVEEIARLRRNINKGRILGMKGKEMTPDEKMQILGRLNEIENSPNILDAHFDTFARAEKMSEFQQRLKDALIEEHPDLRDKLFFIARKSIDGFIAWLLIEPVPDSRTMGVSDLLVNERNAETRPVLFIGADYNDITTLFVTAHEVAHFLQKDTDGVGRVEKMHRWFVEGYQKHREMEVLMSLYKSSETMRVAVDELYRDFSEEHLLSEHVSERAGDVDKASILEKLTAMSSSVAGGYPHETIFVEALIAKLGESNGHEALRDIHQDGDYAKLESFLGKEKTDELRAVFMSARILSVYPLLEFISKSVALSWVLYFIEEDVSAEKSQKIKSVLETLPLKLGMHVNKLSEVQRKLLEMNTQLLIKSFDRTLWEADGELNVESALSKMKAVLEKNIESAASTARGKLLIALSETRPGATASEGTEESGDGTRGELRSELSEAEYLPQVTLKDRARDYSQDELVRLVTFVREHNIPDDVLLGSVSDSLDQLKKSRQPLKPFEIPRAVKVIDQVFDLIDEEITLLITESNIIPYHHDLLVIENSTGRLVAAAPIQIWGAGAARRIMPMWSRTFVQGQGYLQRAIQLLLKSKKIAGWRTEALDEGGDTRTGGVSEMYERMLATGDFERVNIRGTYHSVVQLKDRSELRIFAGEEPIIVPFRREDQRNLGKGTVEPLTPVGLVSRGIRFLTPEMYLDIRQNGFLAPNKRSVESGGSFSKFLDKVSLSISQNERFRSSATHTYGPFLGFGEDIIPIGDHASFVIRRSYIKDHSDDFQLAGRLLDQEESFRKEYQQGLDLIGLGDKQVYIKTDVAFPDEIHADAVPAEAIGGIIVHESLARKIAEWDKQFNLESLPLYLVTEDRHAEQLEVWQEPAEDMPSLSQLRRAELREALSQPTSDLPWYVEISFQTFQAKLFALNRLAELSRGELYHLLKRLLGREIFAEGFESDSDQASLYIPFTTQEQAELGILYKALFAKMDQQEGSSRKRGVIDYRQFDEKELQNESQLENLATSLASQLEMAAFAAQHDSNLEYQLWVPEALESAVHEKLKALMFKRQAMESLPQNLKIMKYPKNLAQAVDATIQRLDQRVAFVGPQADLLDYRPHLLRGSSEEDPDAQVMIALLLGQELLKEALEPTDFYKVYRGSDLYDKWSDLMTAFKSRMAIMASA